MNRIESIIGLLRQLTHDERDIILNIYLFGSIITSKEMPNDIDAVFVTRDRAGTSGWHNARRLAAEIKAQFSEVFDLPLSIMLLTPDEWSKTGIQLAKERILVL